MNDRECVTRVYREGLGQWWAEIWAPGSPAWSDNPLLAKSNPPPPKGMRRTGLSLHFTRRGAERSAKTMRARHTAGHPVSLSEPVIEVAEV